MQWLKMTGLALAIGLCAGLHSAGEKKIEEVTKRSNQWIEKQKELRLEKIFNAIGTYGQITKDRGYLYLTNASKYEPSGKFKENFIKSAQLGSKIFLNIPNLDQKIKNPDLNDVIDLLNFILFAAIPDDKNPINFENLTFDLYGPEKFVNSLYEYLGNYIAKENKTQFQKDSGSTWFSIHLRTSANDTYRNYWLGYEGFKSFGITILDQADAPLEIRPHADTSAKPKNWKKNTNILNVSNLDLLSAYVILNAQEIPDIALLLGEVASDIAEEKTSPNQLTIDKSKKIITYPENKLFKPYIERLIETYNQRCNPKPAFDQSSINMSDKQIAYSLQQYSSVPVTQSDINSFKEATKNGAFTAKKLLLDEENIEIPTKAKKQESEESFLIVEKNVIDTEGLEDYLKEITDLQDFFYTLAIFMRPDGVGPTEVTFGIIGNNSFTKFIYGYLDLIESFGLSLGTTSSTKAANPFAYYRKQSHQFGDSWGLEFRYLAKDINADKDQDSQPLLFPARWTEEAVVNTVFGSQFHLLIGKDKNIDNKIFFKFEDAGLYGGQLIKHAVGFGLSFLRKHGGEKFGMTPDDAPEYNKERVPGIIEKTITKMENDGVIKKAAEVHKVAKTGIAELYAYTKKHKGFEDLTEFLETNYDHPDLRKGNEIIIAPYRDDSCVWIDYFTTKNENLKKIYEDFSSLKKYILSMAIESTEITVKESKENQEFQLVEKENKSDILKEKIDEFYKSIGNINTGNIQTNTYLKQIAELLEKISKVDDKDFETIIKRYARTMFDTHFKTQIKAAI